MTGLLEVIQNIIIIIIGYLTVKIIFHKYLTIFNIYKSNIVNKKKAYIKYQTKSKVKYNSIQTLL
jgi:hypothetical protein